MADPSPRPPAMTVRGLLPSSTGRALRATAPAIVVVSLLYAAQAGLTAVSPLMLQRIIDGAGPGASTSDIVIPGLLAAAAALAGAAVGVAVQQMTVSTGQRFQERLRVLMLGKLTRLPSSAVGSAPGGAMLSRITNDTAQAQSFVSSVLPQSFGLVVHLGVLVGVMWTRSYVITLSVLGLALLLVLPTEKVSRRLNTVTDHMLDAMSDVSGTVVERGGGTGHLFSRTAADIASDQRRAERTAAEVSRSYTRMITINSIFSSSLSLIGALGTVVILVVGGYYVIEGRMTVGALAALAALAPQLYEPLLGASGMRTGLATSWAALSRVHEFLESDEEWYEQPRVPADILIGGALIVRDVDYRVPSQTGEATLLHSVNLTARSGEIVAVVGPSGSGKSTLRRNIPRRHRHGDVERNRPALPPGRLLPLRDAAGELRARQTGHRRGPGRGALREGGPRSVAARGALGDEHHARRARHAHQRRGARPPGDRAHARPRPVRPPFRRAHRRARRRVVRSAHCDPE